MDPSEIGRFGSIRLVSRQENGKVLASFPIDDEEISFGNHLSNHVRLYYKAVSEVHCKIVFKDRKAFVVVIGDTGVVIDGSRVFPVDDQQPTTVPLSNNSIIEIHSKRFRFEYPPKELRAALYASPSRYGIGSTPNHRRALRMSMIQSAQVFSPRPSADPRENLRVLQTPIKACHLRASRSPTKPSALGRNDPYSDASSEDEGDDEEIKLVNGNHPRVVEEEKDLIILEEVDVPVAPSPPATPGPSHSIPRARIVGGMVPPTTPLPLVAAPLAAPLPPVTPRRRLSRPSLHRAVLIRSAQRAVLKAEIDKEEEEEMREVESFIAAEADGRNDGGDEYEHDDEMEEGDVSDASDEYMEETEDVHMQSPPPEDRRELAQSGNKSVWRKSLEAVIWPFSRSSSVEKEREQETKEGQTDEEQDITDVDADEDMIPDEHDKDTQEHRNDHEEAVIQPQLNDRNNYDEETAQALESIYHAPATPPDVVTATPTLMTPPRQVPSSTAPSYAFMTPQVVRPRQTLVVGDKPLRVPATERKKGSQASAWRVRDIEVGVPSLVKTEENMKMEVEEAAGGVKEEQSGAGRGRVVVSEEERKEIQERRRSALKAPDLRTPLATRRISAFPFLRGGSTSPVKGTLAFTSPNKLMGMDIVEEDSKAGIITNSLKREDPDHDDEDEENHANGSPLNNRSLLERMKDTIQVLADDAGRRRSMSPRKRVASDTLKVGDGEFSLLSPDGLASSAEVSEAEVEGGDAMEVDQVSPTRANFSITPLFTAAPDPIVPVAVASPTIPLIVETPPPSLTIPEDIHEESMEEEVPAKRSSRAKATAASKAKPPTVEEEAPATGRSRKGKGTSKHADSDPEDAVVEKAKPRSARGGKKTPVEEPDVEEEMAVDPPAKKTTATRSRKATVTPEPDSSKPVRKSRIPKPQSIAESEDSEAVPPPAPKRGARSKSKAEVAEDVTPDPKPKVTRGSRTKPIEVTEADDDPLDSIGAEDSNSAATLKPKRMVRNKVKVEEEAEPLATTGTRTSRAKKTPAKAAVTPALGTGTAASGSGTRSSSRGKKALVESGGDAGPAVTEEDDVDKENSPAEDEEPTLAPSKAKATRARKVPSTASKAKEEDVVTPAPPTRARATRARTKT